MQASVRTDQLGCSPRRETAESHCSEVSLTAAGSAIGAFPQCDVQDWASHYFKLYYKRLRIWHFVL